MALVMQSSQAEFPTATTVTMILRKVRQVGTASHINELALSSELQPPK